MKLSVIIPALNEEKYIEKTLKSLKKQSIRVEIIVVDNGSSDKTIDISKEYADHVFSYTDKKGPLFAANYGFEHAKGEVIAMAGADCIYPRRWAERTLKLFQNEDVAGVYGPLMFFDSNAVMNFLSGLLYEFFMISVKIFGGDNTSGANFAFRKSIYLEINDFVDSWTTINEDIEIGKRIKQHGRLVMMPFNFSYTSARRFQKNGYFKSAITFLKESHSFKHGNKGTKVENYWNN